MSEESSHRDTVVLLAIAVEGGLIVLAWVLGWVLGQPPLEHFFWTVADIGRGILATLPLLIVFFLIFYIPAQPLVRIRHFSEQILRPLLAPCSWLDLLGISVLA